MLLWRNFQIALRSLARHPMRTGLTALGLAVAACALVTVIAIGRTVEQRVIEEAERLGANVIAVTASARRVAGVSLGGQTRPSLDDGDVLAIRREIEEVELAGGVWWSGGPLINGNLNWTTRIHGVHPEYLDVRNWHAEEGRLFSERELALAEKVVVLGRTVAEKLFPDGGPIGQSIRIRSVPFLVIGVLESKGQSAQGTDYDDIAFLPITTARSRMPTMRAVDVRNMTGVAQSMQIGTPAAGAGDQPAGSEDPRRQRPLFAARQGAGADRTYNQIAPAMVNSIHVRAVSSEAVPRVREQIAVLLRQRHGLQPEQPDDFTIRYMSEGLEARHEAARTLQATLLAVTVVALVVGAISVANVMLASVTERRYEIGMRLAVGARRRDILWQFLTEALAVAGVGAVLGILASLVAGMAVASALLPDLFIPVWAHAAALLAAACTGLLAGLPPALRAARVDPAVTLRNG
ncbi:MAG: ABC transporter permease [Alphaproteobacteria bacterium]|nr:ABC transporter permease [Alphaproteobacteria bacterium]